jgi:two-component system, chemotaxis family, protein-glutamate methylesterase/glutaminase
LKNELSVLVVDDSALMRNLITRMLTSDPSIDVAATAMNGQFALEKLKRLECHVIVLDLEMPMMDGIAFLKERKKLDMKIPVIILSSIAMKGAQVTMEALSLGASDFILKPSGSESHDIREVSDQLIELVKVYGRRFKYSKNYVPLEENDDHYFRHREYVIPEKKEEPVAMPAAQVKRSGTVEAVAIGISTGGPNALREILPKLDKNIPVPILIVQHMPAGFTKEFARSLGKICPLDVKEASDGDLLNKPRIFIAPGDKHIVAEQKPLSRVVRLSDSAPVNGHRPSADVLFASMAQVYRNNCLAVIMTGMGKDGVREIGSIYRAGGLTIAQDEASCIVAGMPKEAVKSGCIHEVVSLNDMADAINKYACETLRSRSS